MDSNVSFWGKLKVAVFGQAKNLSDAGIFHKLSLIAFFAWIGLGSDGLSSSCYGPEEAFLALKGHPHLAIIVALASALTILIIGTSYSQIIELFPSGGGGYVVASRLLSPSVGMVSGCALLIDYVLTIAISVASGSDAIFSFLPSHWAFLKLWVALAGVVLLIVMNLRGIKESVIVLLPVFMLFVVTHVAGIGYAFVTHFGHLADVATGTVMEIHTSYTQLGLFGLIVLLLRAYSMGAGTYTGIEAVSNGVSILREPKVTTAKRTMMYMMVSLAFVVTGLMVAYLLYQVQYQPGKTLNAVLFAQIFGAGKPGIVLLFLTLISEAAILFVAAQTGFIDGPRVIANMAMDRWFPTRFTMLSDRLVTQNGILLMGVSALLVLLLTKGSMQLLVVLYSINVFITFVLSQAGMVKHWWAQRQQNSAWLKKLSVNGIGLVLTSSILVSIVALKFFEGGWITLLLTGALIVLVVSIQKHYRHTARTLRRLDGLVTVVNNELSEGKKQAVVMDNNAKTAVLLVNGFNGLGLHTMFSVFRMFKHTFKNFVIVQVGIVDSGAFKTSKEIDSLKQSVNAQVGRYVQYLNMRGYGAEGMPLIGIDVVDEISRIAPNILKKYPDSIFFGGQLVFPENSVMSRWLHNYTVFAIQRKFYYQGISVMLLPIRI